MRLAWKGLLGVAISAVLIWWTLRAVDFSEVWQAIRGGSLLLLVASVLVATSGFLIRAGRWGVLLRPLKARTSLDARFGAISIGFMANNLLPARMGEFVRVYAFGRMEGVSVSGAFGTLVVERFLDGLVLFAFLLLPMMLPAFPGAEEMEGGAVSVVVRGVLLALIVVVVLLGGLLLWPARVVRGVERLAVRLPGSFARTAVAALEAFLDSLQVLRSPVHFLEALLWSFGFWGFHAISFYLGMAAFGIREGFLAAMFTEAVVGFGVALPAAPGFFGTFHAAANWALSSVYGVAPASSLAFAYGYHLGGFFPITFIGLWYARRIGLSLREMRGSEERVERAVELTHPEAAELLEGKLDDADDVAWQDRAGGVEGAAPLAVREPRAAGRSAGSRTPRLVELDAPAKVNLALRVLEREPSGYHGIETLFQALEWGDRIRVERVEHGAVSLEVRGVDVGPVEENLVQRAAIAFLRAAGARAGVRIRLDKQVPPGTGLGGGSSDAAATLRALSLLFDQPLPDESVKALASELGADVPFFLAGSPLALGQGRGERLLSLPPLPPAPVIVGLPGVHVSTREAYGALDRARAEKPAAPARLVPLPGELEWGDVARLAANDFESVVLDRHPRVAAAKDALSRTRPRLALLTGSGSGVFAVYDGDADARKALGVLQREGGDVRWILTRTRKVVPPPEVP